MPIFTEEILNEGKSRNGFWSNKQLKALGLIEIKKGWKSAIIGKELSEEVIRNFLSLKDKHLTNNDNLQETQQSLKEISIKSIKPNYLVLTREILDQGKSRNGGWSMSQLQILGIIELRKGWKHRIIGKEYMLSEINRFLFLKDKHLSNLELPRRKISYDSMKVVNHDVPVEEQYNHQNWFELRERILQRDDYTCTICKKKYIELHVHHMVYPKGKFIWEVDEKYLIVVCKDCHEKIHDKKL